MMSETVIDRDVYGLTKRMVKTRRRIKGLDIRTGIARLERPTLHLGPVVDYPARWMRELHHRIAILPQERSRTLHQCARKNEKNRELRAWDQRIRNE